MTALRRVTLLIATVVLSISASSCAIQEDAEPQNVPPEERGNFGELATGEAAVGASRIYLLSPIGPDEQSSLRAVPRSEATNPEQLLNSLLAGANEDESALGISTAIPADLEILDARAVGPRLTVDINDALNELSDLGLRQALAQIVATASEIDRIEQVRLQVNGQNQGWPTGDGEVTDRPLTIFDYPGFLESSQPDVPALPSA
jgi:spore germination protein GerM